MHTVSANYLKGILNACIGRGADADKLYGLLENGAKTLLNSAERIDGDVFLEILNCAGKDLGDPHLALNIGTILRPDSLDEVGYAITFCDDLRDALHMVSEYQSISQGFGTTRFFVGQKWARIIWNFHEFIPDTPQYQQYLDLVFSGYATVGRWLLLQSENPIDKVEFTYSEPKNRHAYELIFGPNVTFNAPQNVMYFRPELADVPIASRNPDIKALMIKRLDELKSQLEISPSVTKKAKSCILSLLNAGRPKLGQVAAILGYSDRTFRRKLVEEDTSFRQILESVYKEQCEIMLRNPSQTHAQIALSLGFSDQTAYSRAFTRWYGCSPESYRRYILSG